MPYQIKGKKGPSICARRQAGYYISGFIFSLFPERNCHGSADGYLSGVQGLRKKTY